MKKIVVIPAGDPAGIGPEIIVKALQNKEIYEQCHPLVVGDMAVFERISNILDSFVRINPVERYDVESEYANMNIIDVKALTRSEAFAHKYGEVSELTGRAAYSYICEAARISAADHEKCAMATAPINKQSIRLAGVECAGHTEILAELAQAYDPLTMFQTGEMRIFFLTRHLALKKACEMVTSDRLYDYINRCSKALKMMNITGDLAVAGLNPHNSDGGLFGDEEEKIIEPAIEIARRNGIACCGPVAADSVFAMAKEGRFAAVLSLYHDQGHIAAKTLDFYRTVSLTLGLPYLRASVDHGTGFDIAGKGIANPVSMIEAILTCARTNYRY